LLLPPPPLLLLLLLLLLGVEGLHIRCSACNTLLLLLVCNSSF
jgi:LSD1 subclass zinc finger protein